MARKRLFVDLGKQHDAWVDFAVKNGQRPATLAAAVLKFFLEQNNSLAVEQLPTDIGKRGIYIRLYPDEMECLDTMATEMRKSRQQTIVAILRDAIAAEPQFSLDEEKALVESNFQLSRIGVNLNQIAHRVNSVKVLNLSSEECLKLLQEILKRTDNLNKAINLHVKKVWKLINAGRHRMSLR